MNFAVLQFPGSNCDQDAVHVLRNVLGHSAELLWHKEPSLGAADAVIVPGGFSYGDYLRTGAIARFSPVMQAVQGFAAKGGLVLGICNGFQILCEAGLLPGALIRNRSLQFRCEHVFLKTATTDSPFTNQIPPDKLLRLPIAHGEGCYFADEETLARLKANNQILWRYVDAQGEDHRGRQPERLARQHRRHLQRAAQRRRPHAPPGTGQRADPGLRGRAADFREHDSDADGQAGGDAVLAGAGLLPF